MPNLAWLADLAPLSATGEEPLLERLTGFGRALRQEGLSVGSGRILEFCRAASLVGPADLYWVGRAALVGRHEDIPVYDRVFRSFFGGSVPLVHAPAVVERVKGTATDEGLQGERGREQSPGSPHASRLELLRNKSFSSLTAAELSELAELMARVSLAVPTRRSRRRRPARRGLPDHRNTLRRSFRTGGEPINRAWRERRHKKRRLVLILDVSGSMAPYSRGLVIFAHAALRGHPGWEAFCFGTRLTRITRALAATRPDEALSRAADEVVDWDGGTRIGESLKRFLDRFGHGSLARGAIVVICSDGLDVGDPGLLRGQMQRLGRLAHQIVWLNPLKAHPDYAPLALGMRSALPHVDVFATGHNLASLEAFADQLAAL